MHRAAILSLACLFPACSSSKPQETGPAPPIVTVVLTTVPTKQPVLVLRPPSTTTEQIPARDRPFIEAEIERLRAGLDAHGHVEPVFREISQIQSEVAQRLFGDLRFYHIVYDMKQTEDSPPVSLALGVASTVVVDDGGIVARLYPGGDQEDWGDFLAGRDVRVRSEEDVFELWHARSRILRRSQAISSVEFLDDGRVILELGTHSNYRYYHELVLRDDGRVVSGRLKAEYLSPASATAPRSRSADPRARGGTRDR